MYLGIFAEENGGTGWRRATKWTSLIFMMLSSFPFFFFWLDEGLIGLVMLPVCLGEPL